MLAELASAKLEFSFKCFYSNYIDVYKIKLLLKSYRISALTNIILGY